MLLACCSTVDRRNRCHALKGELHIFCFTAVKFPIVSLVLSIFKFNLCEAECRSDWKLDGGEQGPSCWFKWFLVFDLVNAAMVQTSLRTLVSCPNKIKLKFV
eukprot:c14062_g1_i2.p1 GENE.c14062_g1_i2~~c14062_g1_i2.p1  ORF type:complete len:102 (+),score=14.37 c14062_g1_i2:270-575(+)